MPKRRSPYYHFVLFSCLIGLTAGIVTVGEFIKDEADSSRYQSKYISEISRQLSFKLLPGASSAIRFPEYGPYDERLGYTLLPQAIARLRKEGFTITAQASSSPMMTRLADNGLFLVYHEKTQTGLKITDRRGQEIFSYVYPKFGYPAFEAIPPVILDTLLFIENRELLDDHRPTVNPAIEWDRLGFAGLQIIGNKLGINDNVPGGSTLATQIEKYRHSKNGYTNSIADKFRQMGSASIRAYLLGPDTRAMRRQIALSYLNSMPLAAKPGIGEIHGLGDGLTAWFGADFQQSNRLLAPAALSSAERLSPAQGRAYRQVLSILLSQRRPSYLLGSGYQALENLTDSYLRLLAEAGVIPAKLKEAALRAAIGKLGQAPQANFKFITEKKTQSVLRSRLAKTLGIKTAYELDRLDLSVTTTLDYRVQEKVTQALRRLSQIDTAQAAGLFGARMLNQNADLSPVIYSLMLFERTASGNLLRVQTDNYDQPLDINEGIRLDLGSTAKLRTLVHFLELIADLYQRYHTLPPAGLGAVRLHPRDYLSAWTVEQLRLHPGLSLQELLDLALERRYSASPGEYFFTGGGVHHFSNFDKSEDAKIMSVKSALRDSVNLVFIRLMRDMVYHHLYKPDGLARWLENPQDPRRMMYLRRFAEREGTLYLRRFYARYAGKSADETLALLTRRVALKPSRLTMLYRSIFPERDEYELQKYLRAHVGKAALAKEDIYDLYDSYSADTFDLQDQGFITKIHPLELWLVRYLAAHPGASREEVIAASSEQRQEVYRWLLKGKRKGGQLRRIMTLLEQDAFKEIHAAWRRVGYPFGHLTPSYATSIGASGDRPAALAELMGVIVNEGVRMPTVRFDSLHFAENTPYETILKKQQDRGERIFAPEIARAARSALIGVVEGGTASRLRGVYRDAGGHALAVGGKTGTGDHRQEKWGENGRLLESKFISRAGTFVFFLGERFFGVITAYVAGDNAENYHFTSSLPVQIVKFLQPTLAPLLNAAVPASDAAGLAAAKTDKARQNSSSLPLLPTPVG